MKSNWNYPTTVWVGKNRVNDLVNACLILKIKKPLFVTDKNLVKLPFIKKIISVTEKKINNLNIFSNFTGNPTGKNVEDGVKEFKKNS